MAPIDSTEPLPPEVARFPRARLSVLKGPDKGREVMLEGPPVVIGTDERCQLRLTDTSISRRHLEISGGPNGYRLRDLRSTNGVSVDGVRILEGRLVDAARLSLGRTELRFEPLRQEIEWPVSVASSFGEAIGISPALRRVFAVLERAAASDAPVMLEGETGTGKTLLARALHQRSARREGPLVQKDLGEGDVDWSALFAEAKGGTLVLEELSVLSLALQSKLARAIEEDEGRPRIIATSTREVDHERKSGALREDLYFQLEAFRVRVPPLRERPEDIAPLVKRFTEARGRPLPLGEDTLDMLSRHGWPGNVRELRNAVERLCAFPELGASVLGKAMGAGAKGPRAQGEAGLEELTKLPFHEARERVLETFERAYLTEHLKASGHIVSRAAQRIGLPRQSLYRMLNRLGLLDEDDKS